MSKESTIAIQPQNNVHNFVESLFDTGISMELSSDLFVDTAQRPVRLVVRADLSCYKHTYLGEEFWILKDPLSMKFTRLTCEEYFVLQLLDGNRSLAEIRSCFQQSFPHKSIRPIQFQQMLGNFHRAGLTLSATPGQGEQLYHRRQNSFHQRLLQKSLNLLWIRFRGVDPERFLNATYPFVRFLFHPICMAFCVSMICMACGLALIHAHEFSQQLPTFREFFSADNVILLAVSISITKILHELGHAYACKHFGAECHEIGFLLLIMIPCLYCNTSDAWRLSNKWHRAMIGAAGIYVEIVLASVATFLWWYSHPGTLHYLCLNVMITSSISTVIFNGNPLLRYDGYYILSDVAEIPNLSARSQSVLLAVAKLVLLGIPWPTSSILPRRHAGLFAVYALSSTIYRWFVLTSILYLLTSVFRPYGLQVIGQTLIVVTLISTVAIPLWKTIRFFLIPGRIGQVKQTRLIIAGSIVVFCIAVIVFVPLPCHIMATAELRLDDAQTIYVSSGGRMEYLVEMNGPTKVDAGTTIARLCNRELELEAAELENRLVAQRARLTSILRTQRDRESSRLIPTVEQAISDSTARLAKHKEDLDQLHLVAARAGYVVPSSSRSPPVTEDQLPGWTGTPLSSENQGCYFETGELLCQIGDPTQMEAVLAIPQNSIKFVTEGQNVRIKLDEYPGEILHGKIDEIATSAMQVATASQSRKTGGDLVTRADSAGVERPATVSYEANVRLQPHELALIPGFRGQAKVRVPNRTIAQRFCQFLHETFYFR